MTFPSLQNQIGNYFSHANAIMNTGDWTGSSFAMTTSFTELAGMAQAYVLASATSDIVMTTDGRLKYTGSQRKTFLVTAQYRTVNTNNYAITIGLNGSLPVSEITYGLTGECVIHNVPITLATNDYVSVFGKRATALTGNIVNVQISMFSVND